MPQISSLIMGGSGYTIYFDIGVATLFFTNLNDLPFTLLRLEHRPWTFTDLHHRAGLVQVPMAVVFLAVFHWGPAGYLGANLLTADPAQPRRDAVLRPAAPLPLGPAS